LTIKLYRHVTICAIAAGLLGEGEF